MLNLKEINYTANQKSGRDPLSSMDYFRLCDDKKGLKKKLKEINKKIVENYHIYIDSNKLKKDNMFYDSTQHNLFAKKRELLSLLYNY